MLLDIWDRGRRRVEHLQPGEGGVKLGGGQGISRLAWPRARSPSLGLGRESPSFQREGRGAVGEGQDGAKLHNSAGAWTAEGQGSVEVLRRLLVWGAPEEHLKGDRGMS